MSHQDVIQFWFKELTAKDWFMKSDELDQLISSRFKETLTQAKQGALATWRETPHGRLAEIIVLDQFSRNIFRDLPESFAADELALQLAKEAASLKVDRELSSQEQSFLYMPYMHSESLEAHEEAIKLFAKPGMEQNLEFEIKHKMIIERFGRYPHRNEILGRASAPEEIAFLSEANSSF